MSSGNFGGGGYGPPGGNSPGGGNGPPGGGYGPPHGPPHGPPGGGYGPPAGHYGGPPGGGYGAPPGGYGESPRWGATPDGFVPMPANLPPGYIPDTGTAPLEGGVPWEQKGVGFFSRWWATVKACNGETRPFFAAAAKNESGDALMFSMVSGGVAGLFFGLLYVILFGMLSLGLALGLPAAGGKSGVMSGAFAAGASLGIGIVYAILITVSSAVGAVVRPFVWGGIHHLLLMLFGGVGERKSLMHTVRVYAYTEGAALPWVWIPFVGVVIAFIYGIKGLVVGYDETHKCGFLKAVAALVAIPVCCCLCNVFFMLMGFAPLLMKP